MLGFLVIRPSNKSWKLRWTHFSAPVGESDTGLWSDAALREMRTVCDKAGELASHLRFDLLEEYKHEVVVPTINRLFSVDGLRACEACCGLFAPAKEATFCSDRCRSRKHMRGRDKTGGRQIGSAAALGRLSKSSQRGALPYLRTRDGQGRHLYPKAQEQRRSRGGRGARCERERRWGSAHRQERQILPLRRLTDHGREAISSCNC